MFNRKIWVIFFDAADTLFRVRGSVGDVYLQVAEKYGVTIKAEALNRAFLKACQAASAMAFPEAKSSQIPDLEKNWWYQVVYNVFNEIGMFDGFNDYFNDLYETFRGAAGWELFPETKRTLSQLKGRGYRLGLVSNFDSRIFDVCRALEIGEYIDSVSISSYEGASKPSRDIFLSALRKHSASPDEAMHVGDGILEDVRGAQAAGIAAVLLDRSDRYADRSDLIRIRNLDELLALLDA